MIYDEDTALTTAEFLLQIKAVKLSPKNPFTWASGLKSPIYCDNRKTLSYPRVRTFIRQEFVKIIQEEFISVDVIAGVATGGIAHGALVAQELDLPFVYVRTTQKSHGLENRIEGVLEPDSNVVVVEDLVSTGKNSLNAVKTLRDAGSNVKGMVAIFSYNLNIAEENFTKERCKLITLADYNTLITKAKENNYVMDEDMMSLLKWRKNPEEWGK